MGRHQSISINAGDKFGRLTAIRHSHYDKYGHRYWLCKCDCGNECYAKPNSLTSGHKLSCGCLHKESVSKINRKCGFSVDKSFHKKIYNIWKTMKARCNNPKSSYYHLYGGRGIKVCDEWNGDAKSFHDWAIENGYKEGLSIERIDVNKGYNPDNCKWIPLSEQCYNRRTTLKVEVNGIKKPLAIVAKEYGIPYATLHSCYKRGESIDNYLKTKV